MLYLQRLFELPNQLQTIELSGLTRRRSSFVKMTPSPLEPMHYTPQEDVVTEPLSPIA